MGIGRFAFTPILPMMQEDAGVSIAMGGWLASANYAGYLAGALSVIWWRVGATTGIRAGLAAIGLSTLAMGLVHHLAVWLVLRALAGVASAWVLIYVSAWCLERLALLGRPTLSNTVYAGVGAGIVLAGAVCLALMHVAARSPRAWIVLGALSIVLSVGIWTVFGSRVGSADTAEPAAARGMVWDRESLRLVLCYGAFGFGYIIPATFLPVMAKQIIRDPAVFGWSWPIFGAAAVGSTLATGMLRSAVTNRRLWIASHLVMAFGIALPIVWSGIVPDHARRALRRRHVRGDHHGRHAGGARRGRDARHRPDGGVDLGLRSRSGPRADQREPRGGRGRQLRDGPRDRLPGPGHQRLRADVTFTGQGDPRRAGHDREVTGFTPGTSPVRATRTHAGRRHVRAP